MSAFADLAARLQAAPKRDNDDLIEEVGRVLHAPIADFNDTLVIYRELKARFPAVTWHAGIDAKGAQAKVGEHLVRSKAGVGAAFAAALLLHMDSEAVS